MSVLRFTVERAVLPAVLAQWDITRTAARGRPASVGNPRRGMAR
ncbi:hypothetical protein [Streptomyces sp. NPDC058665]